MTADTANRTVPDSSPSRGVFEYAIQLGDGTMQTGWDEYVGPIVSTWTDRDDALREVNRLICCGIQLIDGVIHRDLTYTKAKLVRRPALAWEPEPADGGQVAA